MARCTWPALQTSVPSKVYPDTPLIGNRELPISQAFLGKGTKTPITPNPRTKTPVESSIRRQFRRVVQVGLATTVRAPETWNGCQPASARQGRGPFVFAGH